MKIKENIESLLQKIDNIRGLFSKDEQEIIYPYSINHGKWFFKYLSFGFLGFIHLLYHLMEKNMKCE
jgi:hypothetical protein